MFGVLRNHIFRRFIIAKSVESNSIPWLSAGLSKNKTFINGCDEIPELQSADENVQRIFSLANASQAMTTKALLYSFFSNSATLMAMFQIQTSQQEKRKVIHKELVKICNNAQERRIAKMTVSIVNLEDHLQKMRNKDKHNKVYLQWLKDQRTKKLKSLKMSNFERYIELLKELKIEPLASTHTKYAKYKFRQFKIGVEIKEKRSQAVRKNPVQLKGSGQKIL